MCSCRDPAVCIQGQMLHGGLHLPHCPLMFICIKFQLFTTYMQMALCLTETNNLKKMAMMGESETTQQRNILLHSVITKTLADPFETCSEKARTEPKRWEREYPGDTVQINLLGWWELIKWYQKIDGGQRDGNIREVEGCNKLALQK